MTAPPDAFLGGRLHLHQPPRGAHRAGTDAILLAHLLSPRPGESLCDLGSGPGIAGLACATLRPGLSVTLVERDPDLAALARANASLNALPAEVIEADVLAPGRVRAAAGLHPDSFDCVLTNPPYFEAGRYRPSPDPAKASAHGFAAGGLEGWVRTCAGILRPGGRLGMIHRADALPGCLAVLAGRFGGIAVRPVHPRADDPAIRILVTAVKGSRAGFSLQPPLVLHRADGRFTPEAEALHRG
ncbi:tRNA1(Val) (adenine(37)-N6)-methyltransferase [Methylobacterium sp. J-076]|uniref:tRNA1(Val) (adenine(37)-N6)-methyltransferase n=1 Tax=Methylobacterium sp. J-076 TaxID=2836655 RepID=UPI001FBB4016|nr:methyltransferase [Methylobacterium sp. J-076]MCJ2015276.1 methyltransferase [Methylobacterium sp. J-076]